MLGKLATKSKKAKETVATRAIEAPPENMTDDALSENEHDEIGSTSASNESPQLNISLGGLSLQYDSHRWKATDETGAIHEGSRGDGSSRDPVVMSTL